MLIAPEFVILWAGRQWYAARDITSKHKGVDHPNMNDLIIQIRYIRSRMDY